MRDIPITAGATRNPIDAMRFISANSTGQTGAWLADTRSTEHRVTVLGSPEALSRCTSSVRHQAYSSTTDLMDKMHAWVAEHPLGLVIHAAAVGDYAVDPTQGQIVSDGITHIYAAADAQDLGRHPRMVSRREDHLVQGRTA